jgi:ATP-dependent Clp protease ATP-binding subunit ClpC
MYRNKSKELLESNPLLALHVMEFLRDNRYVRHSDLLLIISEWTGVPMGKLSKTEAEKLLILEETLKKKVVGQDLAISAVTKALKRSRLGFKPVNKPIASFIFAGPTGVGKTELAKVIADQFFGTIKALVRLDMSEYMEQHSVSKLTGAPPGYVGYEEGGILTNKVRTQSHSVVLFDEIEKAHISIFDLLLQILDDGILTDNEGKQTFFDNSLVILTSNLGAKEVLKEKELRDDVNDKEIVLKVLKEYFRPEFLNRLDEVIVFSALNATYTEKITEMLLQKVVNSLSKKNIYVRLDFNVARHISSSIHDYNYGARPIRRAVTAQVEDALVNKMLQLRIDPKNSGGVKVNCLVVNNSLDFDFIS